MSSNLDTLPGCLDEVEAMWAARAAADPSFPQGVTFERGQADEMVAHETYPRIRWVYGRGTISPPKGRFPGELGQRILRLEAHAWAENEVAAEVMALALAGIATDALSAGRFTWLGEDWTVGLGVTPEGFVVAMLGEIRLPVFRQTFNGVPIGAVAIRKDIDQ